MKEANGLFILICKELKIDKFVDFLTKCITKNPKNEPPKYMPSFYVNKLILEIENTNTLMDVLDQICTSYVNGRVDRASLLNDIYTMLPLCLVSTFNELLKENTLTCHKLKVIEDMALYGSLNKEVLYFIGRN